MQTLPGREMEAAVLEKAATYFRRAQNTMTTGKFGDELEQAFDFNKKIWDVLRADWQNPDSHLPKNVRQDLLSLSVFMTKKSLEFRANPNPASLNIFIQILESLVKGLRTKAEVKKQDTAEPEKVEAQTVSTLNLKA